MGRARGATEELIRERVAQHPAATWLKWRHEEVTWRELLGYCRGRMAGHAVPRYVEFVEALPRTATERNQYAVLRARGITPATWDRDAAGVGPREVSHAGSEGLG
jgi:acyl-CoA synthetase (AMP-forming)/AMP-acid ligase II